MKTKHVISAFFLGIFCLGFFTIANAQTKKANEAEVTFSINITCENCQKKVEAKLPFEKGVKDMKINLEKKEVWILYQTDKTDKEKLVEAIKKIGYEAKEKITE